MPTARQDCGVRDDLEHLLKCAGMGEPPGDDEDKRIQFFVESARCSYDVNPGYPVPIIPEDGVEVTLLQCSDSEKEGDEIQALEYEDDTEGRNPQVYLLGTPAIDASGERENELIQKNKKMEKEKKIDWLGGKAHGWPASTLYTRGDVYN